MGKWSIGLIIAFFLFFAVFWIFIALGQRGGDTYFSNLALAMPSLLSGVSGVFAFLTGLIGVIRNRERSILVFLAMLIGLFVLLFCLAEVIFPH